MNSIEYTATEIQSMVRNMDDSKKTHRRLRESNREEYLKKLTDENPILHFNYPSIFDLHADDKLDETFFYMLEKKRKIEKGEITEDQASIEVGKKLFKTWVEPVTQGRPVEKMESYEEYYKRTTSGAGAGRK
jgi:hypothetical protein